METRVVSGIDFFRKRYEALGGKLEPVTLQEAIRANPLLMDEKALLERLANLGVSLKKIPYAKHGYWVTNSKFSLGAIAEHFLGYYYMQESAAQLPVQVLDPKPGELVLDCCAAPGGKTTQLGEWMHGKGRIIALERKPHRMPALKHNLERMRTPNVLAYEMDAAQAGRLQLVFDKILVDAPCAGNYAADKSWLQKRDLEGIRTSAAMQRRILVETVKLLKPGGIMVYSTCSLEPEENELNMQWLYERGGIAFEDVTLGLGDEGITTVFGKKLHDGIAKCRRFWPHKTKTQGFFVARIRRT